MTVKTAVSTDLASIFLGGKNINTTLLARTLLSPLSTLALYRRILALVSLYTSVCTLFQQQWLRKTRIRRRNTKATKSSNLKRLLVFLCIVAGFCDVISGASITATCTSTKDHVDVGGGHDNSVASRIRISSNSKATSLSSDVSSEISDIRIVVSSNFVYTNLLHDRWRFRRIKQQWTRYILGKKYEQEEERLQHRPKKRKFTLYKWSNHQNSKNQKPNRKRTGTTFTFRVPTSERIACWYGNGGNVTTTKHRRSWLFMMLRDEHHDDSNDVKTTILEAQPNHLIQRIRQRKSIDCFDYVNEYGDGDDSSDHYNSDQIGADLDYFETKRRHQNFKKNSVSTPNKKTMSTTGSSIIGSQNVLPQNVLFNHNNAGMTNPTVHVLFQKNRKQNDNKNNKQNDSKDNNIRKDTMENAIPSDYLCRHGQQLTPTKQDIDDDCRDNTQDSAGCSNILHSILPITSMDQDRSNIRQRRRRSNNSNHNNIPTAIGQQANTNNNHHKPYGIMNNVPSTFCKEISTRTNRSMKEQDHIVSHPADRKNNSFIFFMESCSKTSTGVIDRVWWPNSGVFDGVGIGGNNRALDGRHHQKVSPGKQGKLPDSIRWRVRRYRKTVGYGPHVYEACRDAALNWEFASEGNDVGMIAVLDECYHDESRSGIKFDHNLSNGDSKSQRRRSRINHDQRCSTSNNEIVHTYNSNKSLSPFNYERNTGIQQIWSGPGRRYITYTSSSPILSPILSCLLFTKSVKRTSSSEDDRNQTNKAGRRNISSFFTPSSGRIPSIYALNPVQVVYDIVDQRGRGTTYTSTAYGTLIGHALCGEERVTVCLRDDDYDDYYNGSDKKYCYSHSRSLPSMSSSRSESGAVDIEILSYSRPSNSLMGRILWPFIGSIQEKFFLQQLSALETIAKNVAATS